MSAEILNREKILDYAKRLIEEGRLEKAIQEYKKIIHADPKDTRVKLRIAELHAKLKHVQEAIKIYQEVAILYVEEGFYLKAVTVYKNILRLNPSLVEINLRLAELYEKMGLAKDAIGQYQIVANTFEQRGMHNEALEIRKKIVVLDPHDVSNRVRLAEAYQCEGLEEDAINEYEKLIELFEREGRKERLLELYEKVLSHRPDKPEMLRKLLKMHFKQLRLKEAVRWIEECDAIVSKDPEMLSISAEVYAKLNQIETAKEKYRDLAELYRKNEDVDNALYSLERLLILAPDEEDEVRELVEAMRPGSFQQIKERASEERRRITEEEKHREELEEARKETAKKIAVDGANVTMSALSPEEVSELIKKAEAAKGLADAYKKMGLRKEAEEEYRRSLQIYRQVFVSNPYAKGVAVGMRELEALLGVGEETASIKDESGLKLKETEKMEPRIKKEETGTKVEEGTKPKDRGSGKKKISFV